MPLNPVQLANNMIVRLRSDMGLALIRTFIARGIAAVGSVILLAVIGRLYGAAGVGVYALALSVMQAASIISRYGMAAALQRFIGRDIQSPHVPLYLRYALLRTSIFSVLAAAIIFATRHLWAGWFNTPELSPALIGFAVATPAFTLAFMLAGFMKAIRKPATSMLLQNGAVSLIAALLILATTYLQPNVGIAVFGAAYALAAWVVVGAALWQCQYWFNNEYQALELDGSQPDFKEFNSLSSASFVSSLSKLVVNVASIWIAGFFLPTATVGLFKAAQQVSNLVRTALMVINAIFAPKFATLFHQGKNKALAALARRGVLLGFALAIVPTLVCLIIPGFVLDLFGHDFARAETLLRILAVAQLINITCGSVGNLLNMSGHHRITLNVNLVFNTAGVLFILVFTPMWGITPVALGVALTLVGKNLTNVYFVWARLSIWVIPTSNILKIMGVSRRSTEQA